MENIFDLKKFLVENKLTSNSKILAEENQEISPQAVAARAVQAARKL